MNSSSSNPTTELAQLDADIAQLSEQLQRFGTPSAGNQPIAARKKFIALYNARRRLIQRRQQLKDELLTACDDNSADKIDAAILRPQYDDGSEI
jgi:hypothetical protein